MKFDRIDRDTHHPLAYKVRRGLWNLCWLLLFRPSPKRLGMHWRNWLVRRFGGTVRGSCLLHPSCRILEPWNLDLGEFTAVGERANLYNFAPITIGPHSVVSQDTVLCTGTHDYESNAMPLLKKPIRLGAHVWVTSNCFVHPGVTIGDGCVVGAGSIVTRDLPAWTVCAGNPCRPLKQRIIRDL
jgi:putative colanic acid biosynthesis acetyltransferase WcaF